MNISILDVTLYFFDAITYQCFFYFATVRAIHVLLKN